MSVATIRQDLYTIVNDTADSGAVYDYERWSSSWDRFLALFKVKISNRQQIRGFTIGYAGLDADTAEFGSDTVNNLFRVHTFVIRGYVSLDDSKESEKTAANLAELIANNLDGNAELRNNQTYYDTAPASIDVFEAREFGSVLCHYIEMRVNVTEFVT